MEHLRKKYGESTAKSFGRDDSHLSKAGKAVGISFRNDRNIYPTTKCHILVEHLKEKDSNERANELMEELFERYFCKAENINSDDLLAQVAAKYGIDNAKELIHDEGLIQQIQYKDYQAKAQMRVTGVPFFIIEQGEGKTPTAFSGAQPPDIIAEILEEACDA